MIDVKQAVAAAVSYCEDLGLAKKEQLSLEEVEISDDEKVWYITLGYTEGPIVAIIKGAQGGSKYKVFTVDANDGRIRAMKIRTI